MLNKIDEKGDIYLKSIGITVLRFENRFVFGILNIGKLR